MNRAHSERLLLQKNCQKICSGILAIAKSNKRATKEEQPNAGQTKTNARLVCHVFPRFVSVHNGQEDWQAGRQESRQAGSTLNLSVNSSLNFTLLGTLSLSD